jgi:hypothetical protein
MLKKNVTYSDKCMSENELPGVLSKSDIGVRQGIGKPDV